MTTTIRGRFSSGPPGAARPIVVRADTGQRVNVDEYGRFALDVGRADDGTDESTGEAGGNAGVSTSQEPITLLVRSGPGRVTQVVIDPASADGDLVVVTPEPATDPRWQVAATVERLAGG